jgi:hypothetical protein
MPTLRRIKRAVVNVPEIAADLSGDRDIEWSFIAGHLPNGPGEALDFGCKDTCLSLIAARRGFSVLALDLERPTSLWQHPNRRFIEGDLLKVDLQDVKFDLVINCSSVEHVGLVGRYSVSHARPDGDLEAMRRLRELMKPGAVQLLTIPLGRDAVFQPWHRVYGEKRLPLLLQGYRLAHAEFWCKSQDRTWTDCSRQEAVSFEAAWDRQRKIYALGCFVLQRPVEPSA